MFVKFVLSTLDGNQSFVTDVCDALSIVVFKNAFPCAVFD